jgi:hypothetical protein
MTAAFKLLYILCRASSRVREEKDGCTERERRLGLVSGADAERGQGVCNRMTVVSLCVRLILFFDVEQLS